MNEISPRDDSTDSCVKYDKMPKKHKIKNPPYLRRGSHHNRLQSYQIRYIHPPRKSLANLAI